LKIVENAIKKMQTIINELTDSRKEEHKYKAYEELVNFEHILEDVRLTLKDDISGSGTTITSEVNVSEITYSRRKLRSIVYNLIHNAINFKSPDHPSKIFIKTEMQEDFIIISVRDNGIGIQPDKLESIFSKYFRLENSIEGTGIGLYLVKQIVTGSGGKIEVESKVGEGSEFKVFLKNK
jgi:two-component system phosphate regulon sensor histidine kinase PhoR